MKKIIIAGTALLWSLSLQAQVEVSTASFELESQNKHKGWVILEAGKEGSSGDVFVKLGKATCDIDKSSVGNINYTTFNGLGWTIDKLVFSPRFEFKSSSSKSYASSREALASNELLFGRLYSPILGNGVGAALTGVAMPTRPINNAFMFSNIVVGTAGISGFKVATSYISTQLVGEVTKTKGDICGENPAVYKIDAVDAKEEKGQRWIPVYNNPVPGGGNILFNTVGVSADPNVQYYVFRKYDKGGNVIKEKAFSFDYQCLPTVKEIERAPGIFDYVFIMSPINYKKSKLRVAPANQYEYIKVDGETFEIKEQFSITAPLSQWSVGYAIEAEGAIYLAGVAGEKNSIYLDFSFPKPADYPNFQLAKIAGGKLVYINATNEEQSKAASKSIEGLKSKAPFHYHLKDVQMLVKNGRFIICGQQEINAVRGSLVTAVFGETGSLEAFLSRESKEFARGRVSLNADGSKLFWLLEDLGEYNTVAATHVVIPKKAREAITALSILSYSITGKQLIKYQELMNEEWAVNYKNPVLYESDSELLLLGNKITRKAKEGELVFITLKK